MTRRRCVIVELDDGTQIAVMMQDGVAFTEQDRAALTAVVDAARRRTHEPDTQREP